MRREGPQRWGWGQLEAGCALATCSPACDAARGPSPRPYVRLDSNPNLNTTYVMIPCTLVLLARNRELVSSWHPPNWNLHSEPRSPGRRRYSAAGAAKGGVRHSICDGLHEWPIKTHSFCVPLSLYERSVGAQPCAHIYTVYYTLY